MAAHTITQFNPELETVNEFLERFKVQSYDALSEAGADGKKKAAILVKALPIAVITDLQRRIKPVSLTNATFDLVEAKLIAQHQTKHSIVGASVKFINRKQGLSEPIETYAKVLNNLAADCQYKNCCRDRLLRDTFVSGLRSNSIMSLLLQDCEGKSFDECVEKAKLFEQISVDAQSMSQEPQNTFKIVSSNESGASTSVSTVPDNYVCIRCGAKSKHFARNCYALNIECRKCSKQGHIAKVCKSRSPLLGDSSSRGAHGQKRPTNDSSVYHNSSILTSEERQYDASNKQNQNNNGNVFPRSSSYAVCNNNNCEQELDSFLG